MFLHNELKWYRIGTRLCLYELYHYKECMENYLLLKFEQVTIEVLLQSLICIIDAELFKTISLKKKRNV